jgi:hypothetical protein
VSKEVAVLVTVAAGGFVAAQAPANNVLSKSLGTFGAASVNFLVGTACVLLVTFAFAGGFSGQDGAETPPWYYWLIGGTGGMMIAPFSAAIGAYSRLIDAPAEKMAMSMPSKLAATSNVPGTAASAKNCSSPLASHTIGEAQPRIADI